MEPDTLRKAFQEYGMEKTLTELVEWVEENQANDASPYLHKLKNDLKSTLFRYSERKK